MVNEVDDMMKHHNDLAYLGLELESPKASDTLTFDDSTLQHQPHFSQSKMRSPNSRTQQPSSSSIMSHFVRRSFSIKGLGRSVKGKKHNESTPTNEPFHTSEDISTKFMTWGNEKADSLRQDDSAAFMTRDTDRANSFRQDVAPSIMSRDTDKADNTGQHVAVQFLSRDIDTANWVLDTTKHKNEYDLPIYERFKSPTKGPRLQSKAVHENLERNSNTECGILVTNVENISSNRSKGKIFELEECGSSSNDSNENPVDFVTSTNWKSKGKGIEVELTARLSPTNSWTSELTIDSVEQTLDDFDKTLKQIFSSGVTVDALLRAELTPEPLHVRHSEDIPVRNKRSGMFLTPVKPRFESLQNPQRSPVQENLMPKPLTIRKIRISDASSDYSRASLAAADDESIYELDSSNDDGGESRLRYYQRFFNNRPLMRCLDTGDEEDVASNMYTRLLEETKHSESYRGELQVRRYWNNTRAQLREEFEEIKNALPDEEYDIPAWGSGKRDTIDDLLDRYGLPELPEDNFIQSSPP